MSIDPKSPLMSDVSSNRQAFSEGIVTPATGMTSAKSVTLSGGLTEKLFTATNPFKMPPDCDIFLIRDAERQKKKKERERQKTLQVHEKMTYTTKINQKSAHMMRDVISDENGEDEDNVKADPGFAIAVTRDRHIDKETLAEYINKKREMFLVQYSLGVKRDEMRKLEEVAQVEERKLELAEQYLEEDATMFDEFLKENDRSSVEAIKAAEAETKVKLEKVAEIKKLNTQMISVKSDISKYEDMLKECMLYRKFLDKVTPFEWKNAADAEVHMRNEERKKELKWKKFSRLMKGKPLTPPPSFLGDRTAKRGIKLKTKISGTVLKMIQAQEKQSSPVDDEEEQSLDVEEDEPLSVLYFSDPSQLLDIFGELEEQNLSLIQNSQETEEALEEIKQAWQQAQDKMDKETDLLKEQISNLEAAIEEEEKRAEELEVKSKMFSFGEFKGDAQEQMLAELNDKVEEVYRGCIGDNEASISTLQMLTNIENRLEELFETIEMMPANKVEIAEKAKEKERRIKLREEKLEQQRMHQEERMRRALERAKAEPKKPTGKKLVFRSEPPRIKKKRDRAADLASREEEELAFYFQW